MIGKLLLKLKTEKNNSQVREEVLRSNCQQLESQQIFITSIEEIKVISRVRYGHIYNIPTLQNYILQCKSKDFIELSHSKRRVKQIDLRKEEYPSYLLCLKALVQQQIPNLNHILINVYPAGRGIMPHTDGPLYAPKVWVLSLGGPAVISFTHPLHRPIKLLLQDKSLHIFQSLAYTQCLHGIEDYSIDSIFILVVQKQYIRSSIDNFPQTLLYKDIMRAIIAAEGEEIELLGCVINRVVGNAEWNWKVEVRRRERISITMREKYLQ